MIKSTSRQILEKTLPGQKPANQVQRSAFDQSAQRASTNPQQNSSNGWEVLGRGVSLVEQKMAEVDKRSKEVDAAQAKILSEETQRSARLEVLKELKPFLQKRGILLDEIQSEAFGTKDFKPGISNPMQLGDLSLQQRGDLVKNESDLMTGVRLREQGVGNVVAGMAKVRELDLKTAQQNFDNARGMLQDALSLSANERANKATELAAKAQQMELYGLTANQRADMAVKLIDQGYDSNDVGEIIDRYSGGFTPGSDGMRTDRHNNPAAFTTDIAKQAGLVEGVDYEIGDPFPNNPNLKTARLLGDPIATTIKVIDKIGFTTQGGQTRWTYTNNIPGANNAEWKNLTNEGKAQVIAKMYQHEGGNGSLIENRAHAAVAPQIGPVAPGQQPYGSSVAGAQTGAPTGDIEARRQANLKAKEQAGAAAKPPIDSQNKAATFHLRANNSDGIIRGNENTIKGMSAVSYGAQRKLPNFLKSDLIQSEEQAERDFVNAILRRESGAVISPDEFDNARKQYFVQPGDNQSTIIQKQRNRSLALQGLSQEAGNALMSGKEGDITSVKNKYNVSY